MYTCVHDFFFLAARHVDLSSLTEIEPPHLALEAQGLNTGLLFMLREVLKDSEAHSSFKCPYLRETAAPFGLFAETRSFIILLDQKIN